MSGQSKSYRNKPLIKTVSLTEQLRLYYLGVLFMFWILFKLVVRSIWQYFFCLKSRNFANNQSPATFNDRPPSFLIDGSCGTHSYLKLKTVKFHYVEAGRNTSPLIVLLHGFPDCWYGWRFQIELLSQYFHVISFDLKGFGDSEKPSCKKSYRIDRLLSELKQSIEILKGSRPCSLIGHDLGALLGWFLITQNPGLCASFVSVCSPHPNFYWNNAYGSRFLSDQWIGFMQIPLISELEIFQNRTRILHELFAHIEPEKSPIFNAYTYMFSRRQDWIGPLNYFRNLPFLRIQLPKSSKIEIPVMLIAGKSDKISQLDDIVTSSDYCENFIMKIIENSGHWPHQENPQLFNSLLVEFLVQKVHSETNQMQNNQQSFTGDLIQKMFSAVSSTVKIGSNVIDTVQKRTNNTNKTVPIRILNFGYD